MFDLPTDTIHRLLKPEMPPKDCQRTRERTLKIKSFSRFAVPTLTAMHL